MNIYYGGSKATKNCDECEEGAILPLSNFRDQIWQTHLQNREIIINGEINEDLIERAVLQVFAINRYDYNYEQEAKNYTREPITIFINSPGGVLDEAFSLISAIESSQTPVVTIALGKAWSAAFLILLSGHTRACQRHSSLMVHQLSAGISGEFKRIHEYTAHYEKYQEKVESYVIERCKIPKKKLTDILNKKHDWYLGAEEALKLKIIDQVI